MGHTNGLECTNEIKCMDCSPNAEKCFVPKSYYTYNIKNYGNLKGEYNMINEL